VVLSHLFSNYQSIGDKEYGQKNHVGGRRPDGTVRE
jgi:hypothetical protein